LPRPDSIAAAYNSNSDNKAVWENTGLIPKYYKPYSLIEADNLVDSKESPAGSVPLYQCHFCKMIYKGSKSLILTKTIKTLFRSQFNRLSLPPSHRRLSLQMWRMQFC
jgi:hypothetical protein